MKALNWLLALGFVLLAASVFFRTYSQAHKDPDQDEEEEAEAIRAPSRAKVVNGETVLTLSAADQKRLDIVVKPLPSVNARATIPAAAAVLATQNLVTLRNAYVAAAMRVETTQAQLEVAQQEYGRLNALYADNQNTSKKALQAAEGTVRADTATLDAARKQVELARSAVQQSWGSVVAKWVADDSLSLRSVLAQRGMLVQLTLPPETPFEDPPEIRLSTPSGATVTADYVSPFPQVDPRIQGISELYLGHAYPILEPGMYLIARLPVGQRLRGVLIPHSAIVWWQGQPWVYERTAPTRFTRRGVPAGQPLGDGYFAPSGFARGTEVVTRGAQVLLSEEFRSQIQPED